MSSPSVTEHSTIESTHPNDDSPWFIRGPDLEICAFRDMVEEELEEVFGLFMLVPHDALREALVDVKRLFAGDRVHANERVLRRTCVRTSRTGEVDEMTDLGLDGLAPQRSSALPGVVGLRDGRVQRPQPLQAFLELG